MIRFTEPCPQCEGTGGQMHQHIVGVAGHAPGCDGVTCAQTCPVEVPMPVEEFEPCPHCFRGTVPDDATVEAAARARYEHRTLPSSEPWEEVLRIDALMILPDMRAALIAAAHHQREAQ